MKFTKTSPVTGKPMTLDLNVTQEQVDRWNAGEHIQNVMPQLTADEREFLISGLAPGEFDELFKEEKDYDSEDTPPEPAF